MNERVKIKLRPANTEYDVLVGAGSLDTLGDWVKATVGPEPRRAAIVSNKTVFDIYGGRAVAALSAAGIGSCVHLIGDGERYKDLRTLRQILDFWGRNAISRTDVVVALGGGVVGDAAGFAASIHLRGVPLLQVPTTLLAMLDSSVGGKTGVNTEYGKNSVGSFYQPRGVLIDVDVLRTLATREATAGFCEAVKHAVLSGAPLFAATRRLLDYLPAENLDKRLLDLDFRTQFIKLLARQISFKAKIVAADPFEMTGSHDASSRKILNLGHTLAHALEKATGYRRFRHGEAVGYGLIFAAELSKNLELIDQNEVDLLNELVRLAGKLPALDAIDRDEVFDAFRYDKKVIGGSLQLVLLKGLGKPVIFPFEKVSRRLLIKSYNRLLDR